MTVSLEQLKEQLVKIETVLAGELSEIDRLQLESDRLAIQSQIDERTVLGPAPTEEPTPVEPTPAPEVPAEPVQEPAPTPVEEPAPVEPAPETPVEEPAPAPVEEPTPVEPAPEAPVEPEPVPEAPVEPAPEIPAEPLPTPEPGDAEPVPAPAPIPAQYPTDEEHILVGQSGDEELKAKFLEHVKAVALAKMAGN